MRRTWARGEPITAPFRCFGEAEARLRDRGVELWLAALNPEALDLVRRTALADRLGDKRMFFTVEDSVAAYQKRGIA